MKGVKWFTQRKQIANLRRHLRDARRATRMWSERYSEIVYRLEQAFGKKNPFTDLEWLALGDQSRVVLRVFIPPSLDVRLRYARASDLRDFRIDTRDLHPITVTKAQADPFTHAIRIAVRYSNHDVALMVTPEYLENIPFDLLLQDIVKVFWESFREEPQGETAVR